MSLFASPTFIVHLLLAICWQAPCQCIDKVRLDKSGNFVDKNNRILVLHGVNWIVKYPPWYDRQMLNETKLMLLQRWGFNVIRLGVMWSGVMPQKDNVNTTYMQIIESVIDKCANYQIYVLIDMHQDMLSSRFNAYDGLPLWLVDMLPSVKGWFKYPWPFQEPPKEMANYLTYACAECALQFYTNVSNSWKYWGDYWATIASRFSKKSNVIGYELINEPPLTNFYSDFRRILPAYNGKHYLLPVYDYLVGRIREHDPVTLIFYEPLTYGVFLRLNILDFGTGFDRVPGSLADKTETSRSVLSYHYYCWLLQVEDSRKNMSFFQRMMCDHFLLPQVFENSLQSAKQTGGGRFLTEFGLCGADGNPRSINTLECNAVMDAADKHIQSWSYWDGIFFDHNGNPKQTQLKTFSRTYPLATFGQPIGIEFDTETGNFRYAFLARPERIDEGVPMVEIYLADTWHYPDGLRFAVQPQGFNVKRNGSRLYVYTPNEGITTDTRVEITVSAVPKSLPISS